MFLHRSSLSDWGLVNGPAQDKIIPFDTLPDAAEVRLLNKLAVLKVNGGLGTSMGKRPVPVYIQWLIKFKV